MLECIFGIPRNKLPKTFETSVVEITKGKIKTYPPPAKCLPEYKFTEKDGKYYEDGVEISKYTKGYIVKMLQYVLGTFKTRKEE